jgi:DNA-binding PadR family transcriptional regulator
MSVKHALLGILAEQPQHGYDLKQAFENKVGDFWSLNYGQIYTTLERLYDNGFVDYQEIEQSDKPDKKIYRITAAGREVFDAWRSSPVKAEPRALRDELFLKLVFMDQGQIPAILNLIRTQQSVYMAHMMQLTNRKYEIEQRTRQKLAQTTSDAERSRIEHECLMSSLLIDVALYHAEADIRWLRHCEAKVGDASSSIGAGYE